jgi:tetratricopeptide (TPR) repeat protein
VRKTLAPTATIAEEHDRLALQGDVSVDAIDLLSGIWDDAMIDELTRGELLEGIDADAPEFDRWLSVQRARIATARVDALRSCAAACLRADPLRALQLAERALASEPFDDGLHELTIEAHCERGDTRAALRYFDRTDALYRRELGVAPPARLKRALERKRPERSLPLVRLDIEARVLFETARARAAVGAWDDARSIAARAIDAASESGDRALEIRGTLEYLNIASCQMSRGSAEWNPLLQRAFTLATELGDRELLCDVEAERGRFASIEARYGTAEAMLHRALSVATELNDPLRVAAILGRLGVIKFARGDHAGAERDLRASAEHPARRSIAMAYLAVVLAALARWDEVEAIAEAKALWSSPEQLVWQPLALVASGDVQLARGDLSRAIDRYGTALAMGREMHDTDWMVLALRGLARVDRIEGRPERALTTMRQAADMAAAHLGCQRWCEALVLADLIEWEEGRDRARVDRALRLATSAPMPDIASRIAPYAKERQPVETATA